MSPRDSTSWILLHLSLISLHHSQYLAFIWITWRGFLKCRYRPYSCPTQSTSTVVLHNLYFAKKNNQLYLNNNKKILQTIPMCNLVEESLAVTISFLSSSPDSNFPSQQPILYTTMHPFFYSVLQNHSTSLNSQCLLLAWGIKFKILYLEFNSLY